MAVPHICNGTPKFLRLPLNHSLDTSDLISMHLAGDWPCVCGGRGWVQLDPSDVHLETVLEAAYRGNVGDVFTAVLSALVDKKPCLDAGILALAKAVEQSHDDATKRRAGMTKQPTDAELREVISEEHLKAALEASGRFVPRLSTLGWIAEALLETQAVLSDLVDLQNGPPLPGYEKAWNATMNRARALLGSEGDKPSPPPPPAFQCSIHCGYCCPGHNGQATHETCQDTRCADMRRIKASGARNWLGHSFLESTPPQATGGSEGLRGGTPE